MLREPVFSQADLEFQRRLSPYSPGDVRYRGTIAEQIDGLNKVTIRGSIPSSTAPRTASWW
jgi:hypothetical protein